MKIPLAFIIGCILSFSFLLMTTVSLFWIPHEVEKLNILERLKGPSYQYFLGTDHFGRDIFSMLMVGGQTSITVALIAVGVGMIFGIPLGLLAAASRQSIWDDLIMRSNDLIFAFPSLVIAILITAVFGPSAINAIIAIGIFNVPVFARVSRGAALSIWTLDFILSARIAGKGSLRISVEHILPNILSLLIVQGSIQFSLGILAEAGLSYVGLGVQPPTPSWGRMLADSQTMISFAPNLALFPGITIILAVLGLNLLGDGARDLLDPRLQDKIR